MFIAIFSCLEYSSLNAFGVLYYGAFVKSFFILFENYRKKLKLSILKDCVLIL